MRAVLSVFVFGQHARDEALTHFPLKSTQASVRVASFAVLNRPPPPSLTSFPSVKNGFCAASLRLIPIEIVGLAVGFLL